VSSATTREAVAAEERAAVQQHRNLTRAQRAAARARERDYRERLRRAIRDFRHLNSRCRCDFTGVKSREDLTAMSGGCTDPNYVCPRLDAVRRKMG
jgi:hypothetical protein